MLKATLLTLNRHASMGACSSRYSCEMTNQGFLLRRLTLPVGGKPSSGHFCAGQGAHDRFGQLPHTEWLREQLCIGAELVGHQRGIREAGHKKNRQVGPS